MFPGLMERLVAPDVVQLSVLLPPSTMLVGFAANEPIEGKLGCVTVIVTVAAVVPVVLVAVSVYVVVAVGLRVTEPLAAVDEKLPGVTVMAVAPDVAQLTVVLAPATIEAGLAPNEAMVGSGTCTVVGVGAVQPVIPTPASRVPADKISAAARRRVPDAPRPLRLSFPVPCAFLASMLHLSAARCLDRQKRGLRIDRRRSSSNPGQRERTQGKKRRSRMAQPAEWHEAHSLSNVHLCRTAQPSFRYAVRSRFADSLVLLPLLSTLPAESAFGNITKVTGSRDRQAALPTSDSWPWIGPCRVFVAISMAGEFPWAEFPHAFGELPSQFLLTAPAKTLSNVPHGQERPRLDPCSAFWR